jgi:hypothetical protein
MAISCSFMSVIDGYWYLFYLWLLIFLMVIILIIIDSYSIGGY